MNQTSQLDSILHSTNSPNSDSCDCSLRDDADRVDSSSTEGDELEAFRDSSEESRKFAEYPFEPENKNFRPQKSQISNSKQNAFCLSEKRRRNIEKIGLQRTENSVNLRPTYSEELPQAHE